jgi:hypothetical protein
VICDIDGRPVTPAEAKQIIAEQFTVTADQRARHRMGKAPQQVLKAQVRSHTNGMDRRGDLPHHQSSPPRHDHVNRRTA